MNHLSIVEDQKPDIIKQDNLFKEPVSKDSLDFVRERFINYLKESAKSPRTIGNYKVTLKHFYDFLKEKSITAISDISQAIILQYQDYVYETLDYSQGTLKFYINDLRRFFDHLIKLGIVYTNPVLDIQIKQKKIEPVDVISRYYSTEELIRKYKHRLREKMISFLFYERERASINTFISFIQKKGINSIYKVNSNLIEEYRKYLSSSEYNNGKGSNIYVQIEKLRALKRFYKWLIKEKILKDNPSAYLDILGYMKILRKQPKNSPKPQKICPKGPIQLYQDKYLEYKKSIGLNDGTIKGHRHSFNLFNKFLKSRGITTPEAVGKEEILCYLNYLCNIYKTSKGSPLSQNTKSRLICVVRKFFSFLMRFEYIQKDPTQTIDTLKSDDGIPRTLMSPKEVNTLLNMPDLTKPTGIRDRAMLETLYSTGIRATELCFLRKDDIYFTQGLIRINHPKGGREQQRVIPIGKMALHYIILYLNKARDYLAKEATDILFLSMRGKQLCQSELRRIIQGYVFKARFRKNITTHSFRVTCATEMLRNKADIRYVQQQLGHKKITSTQIYTRVVPVDLKKVHSQTHPRERFKPESSPKQSDLILSG